MKETDEEIGARARQWNTSALDKHVVAIVFEGPHAVEAGRKIVRPAKPRPAPPGTIRGDFSVDSFRLGDEKQRPTRNLVRASGSIDEADKEIKAWFDKNEIHDYDKHDFQIMYG